mmetsp:Transcript_74967/g.119116  ORF Transcript_74967/g.119116 Transcript_74967/m.119116 type:complete len:273 (+) Transcript_74967:49-867(+)
MTCCSSAFKIELRWPEQIATSNWLQPRSYLIFNCILAIVFVAFQLLNLYDAIPVLGGYYFIYLTVWALVLQTITMVTLFICTLWAYVKLTDGPDGPSQGQAPLFVRYTVAFWYIIQPVSMIVMILYWTLVNPIWDPYPVVLSNYWAHFWNWVCLFISLFASRIPWSCKNFVWGLLFLLTYLGYTVIHFFAGIGTAGSCELYIDPECPIYDEFDWNMPGITTLIVLATVVIYGVIALLYTGLFRCRDSCSPAMTFSDASGKEAETKDEPENGA